MNPEQDKRLFILGGICGIVGTACYVLVSAVSTGWTLAYLLAMCWPILSLVFLFSLYRYVAISRQGPANQLAFLFAGLAFAMVAIMISVQLGVRAGIEQYIAEKPGSEEMLRLIRQSVRLVDMGIDVAWDLFIGTALIFLCFAILRHGDFGVAWGIPAGVLGLLLIVLNVATFPWPPNTQGLIDIGPAIGVFIIALSGRLLQLGLRFKRGSTGGTDLFPQRSEG